MAGYYDSTVLSKDDLGAMALQHLKIAARSKYLLPAVDYTIPDLYDTSNEDDNLVFDIYKSSSVQAYDRASMSARFNSTYARFGFKVNVGASPRRLCLVRFKSSLFSKMTNYSALDSDWSSDLWILLGRHVDFGTVDYKYITNNYPALPTVEKWYNKDGSVYSTTTSDKVVISGNNALQGTSLPRIIDSTLNNYLNSQPISQSDRTLLEVLIARARDDMTGGVDTITFAYPNTNYVLFAFLPSGAVNDSGMQIVTPVKIPNSIPVFDARDNVEWEESVYKYLVYGDDSGRSDPFDPNKKEDIVVTDYTTDFTVYLTKGNGSKMHLSITSANREYNANRDVLNGKYALIVSKGDFYDSSSAIAKKGQVPTVSGDYPTDTHLNMMFAKYPFEAGMYSGMFTMYFAPDNTSASGSKVTDVYWTADPNGTEGWTRCSRSTYGTDGYIYTCADTTETLILLFRSISLDDLKDITDGGYPPKPDEDDNSTGDDNVFVSGRGLRTYKITQAGFDAINEELWTTNWTEVFKSNTIDPIKCVISSKKIPFTTGGTPSEYIWLANRVVNVVGSYISPVKMFDIGSVRLEAIYGNFVDVTLAKIHCYLPFIGWIELPASEVMCRVGRAQVGLQSKTHTLHFKYIVDFVDGNCRCIISVDGTERWYFDGNCSIDVPVSSDGHTQAVSTAIRTGVASGLKIVGGIGAMVGGMFSGNALAVGGGALSAVYGATGLADTDPTYDYSASCSPSGYIEADMNHNIMIVIEYPNAYYPSGYGHKVGYPCMLNLSLGQCTGFTKTMNVDVTGINCTQAERDMIKELLDSGVFI